MKRIISLTIWLVFLAWSTSFAQVFGTYQVGTVITDTGNIALPTGGVGAHSAGDVIAQSLTASACPLVQLDSASRNNHGFGAGSGGYITYVKVEADTATSGTVLATFYKDTLGMTYFADNAAFAPTFAMGRYVIGTVSLTFSTQGSSGGSRAIAESSCLIPYRVKAGQVCVYMRLSCVTAVTLKYVGNVWYGVSFDRN